MAQYQKVRFCASLPPRVSKFGYFPEAPRLVHTRPARQVHVELILYETRCELQLVAFYAF